MYVAYYGGGLRIVDISGELMGDLYRQGREIANSSRTTPRASCRTTRSSGGRSRSRAYLLRRLPRRLWAVRLVDPPADEVSRE